MQNNIINAEPINIIQTGNWFVDQLSIYQNANNDNASVKKNFVVRVAEFRLIISDLKNKSAKDPLQHELLLGRRGSGKSTLLKRIQIEIEEDQSLSLKYIPINLAEEQAGIYRLSDLWFETLQELSKQTHIGFDLLAFSTFESNHAYTRYLYTEIHQILQKVNKKAVLLLDNIDRIVENMDDDGHLLRETLLNYNEVQIIGGSTRMDEHFWKYDKPFYEFFRRHRLTGLTFDEIDNLLNQWSDAMQLLQLKNYAQTNRGKIESLRILTDGLPRTLQFFIQILLHDAKLSGFEYIKKVMDKASPLYQERLNNLTAPQRKIVLEMAFVWEACSTKQLIEVCRMEGKLIASYMKQLNSYGIVETIPTDTKNHLYRLSERFFNMWLIVTQGNPDQKRRAKYLTIFLETWYDGNEIQKLGLNHFDEIKGGKYSFKEASILTKAISQSKHIGLDERDNLIKSTNQLNEGIAQYELPELSSVILEKIYTLADEGKFEEGLKLTDEIENEEDGVKFGLKGYFYEKLKKLKEAEEYYLKSVSKGNKQSIFKLANFYRNQRNPEKAESYYVMAKENNPEALYNLANLYRESKKEKEAEEYYLKAIDKKMFFAFNNLAFLYESQGKYIEAEKYYLLAIDNKSTDSLYNLAILYFSINKNKKKALDLVNQYFYLITYEDWKIKFIQILIEIWNGQFDKTLERIKAALIFNKDSKNLNEFFLENLLNLEQISLVLSLFEDEEIGKDLQEEYKLLYYATLILNQKTENNLMLRIPPDVLPTVEAIIANVKEKQAFYAD